MARTAGRTGEETKRAILDAAVAVIARRGDSASLEAIAAQAGVSKGGLLYHFHTRDDLVVALAQALFDEFRDAVHAAAASLEPGPGRLTRAYILACLEPVDTSEARRRVVIGSQLRSSPAVLASNDADLQRWMEDLAGDGLDETLQAIVIAAADGLATAPLLGTPPSPEHLDRLRQGLMAMIDDGIAR